MSLPTDEEIRALHEKYAPNRETFDRVYGHCQIVAEIADELLAAKPQPEINRDLVHAGCLLHDIGAYKVFDVTSEFNDSKYIQHGIRGEEILTAEGYDQALAHIASHHTGVGLTAAHIEQANLPLPHQDFLAETAEERLVMYADKFHSKVPALNSFETYRTRTQRFGEGNAAQFDKLAEEFGKPEHLAELAAKYDQPLE